MRGLLSYDTDSGYELHPRVALRPEPFGAMAYHYDNRRLNFLRSHDLVAVVEHLADHPTPRAAMAAAGVKEKRWPAFEKALERLEASDFIRKRAGHTDDADE